MKYILTIMATLLILMSAANAQIISDTPRFNDPVAVHDSLKAPDATALVDVRGFCKVAFWIKAIDIDTTLGIVTEEKLGSGNWVISGYDSLIWRADSDSIIRMTKMSLVDSARVRFLSESGGSAGILIIQSKRGLR